MRKRQHTSVSSIMWRNLGSLSSSASHPSPPHMAVHELVDMSLLARASLAEREARKRGPKSRTNRVSIGKGKCSYVSCPAGVAGYSGPLVSRPTTRCIGCKGGKGAYYHLPCFFEVHSATCSDSVLAGAAETAESPGS